MPRAQTGLEQLLAESRQQSESTIFEEQFILHPYCESRMYLLCTFKIITKSPCFNGSGAARRPYQRANRFVPLKRWTNEPSFHKPFSTRRFEAELRCTHTLGERVPEGRV